MLFFLFRSFKKGEVRGKEAKSKVKLLRKQKLSFCIPRTLTLKRRKKEHSLCPRNAVKPCRVLRGKQVSRILFSYFLTKRRKEEERLSLWKPTKSKKLTIQKRFCCFSSEPSHSFFWNIFWMPLPAIEKRIALRISQANFFSSSSLPYFPSL